jgi:hypothetical protein
MCRHGAPFSKLLPSRRGEYIPAPTLREKPRIMLTERQLPTSAAATMPI